MSEESSSERVRSSSPRGLPSESSVPNQPRKRVLSVWDLIIYGIVLIQPIAPVGIFGIVVVNSRGHVVLTILIAMVAMMLTAMSYGRMAARYPSAGSAYTYVGRTFGPYAGFLTGWAMFLDYLIIPAISTVYGALTLQRLAPAIPYPAWVALIVGLLTFLNLRGVSGGEKIGHKGRCSAVLWQSKTRPAAGVPQNSPGVFCGMWEGCIPWSCTGVSGGRFLSKGSAGGRRRDDSV